MNDAALAEWDLQRKTTLATQSQLMREAAEASAFGAMQLLTNRAVEL
jgi:hypothetical protein